MTWARSADTYRAPGLPATLFIGRDGVLKHSHLGEISPEEFRRRMLELDE